MIDDLDLRNARSVVAGWRANNHLPYWEPQAHHLTPADVARATAVTWDRLRRLAADEADRLEIAGWRTNHSTIIELRTDERRFAARAQRSERWYEALKLALEEPT